jgi:hypothetical protein
MTQDHRGKPGLAVAPARLAGPAERRRSVLAATAVGLATVVIVAIGWFGSHSDAGSTAEPSRSPDAGQGAARRTPGPAGSAAPLESFWTGPYPSGEIAMHWPDLGFVDLDTGRVSPVIRDPGRGALVRDPYSGGWICICISVAPGAPPSVTEIQLVRISADARAIRHTVIDAVVLDAGPDADVDSHVDVAFSPDRRLAYLATSRLTSSGWQIALERLDLSTGFGLERVDVLTVPLAAIPGLDNRDIHPDVHATGPSIRVSPDGRMLIGWAAIDERAASGAVHSEPLAWAVPLGSDGALGAVSRVSSAAATSHPCEWTGFVTPDVIITVCPTQTVDDSGRLNGSDIGVRTYRPDGSEISSATIAGGFLAFYGEPLIDQANALVYLWDPHRDRLTTIDVRDGRIGVIPDRGVTRRASMAAVWSRPDSSLARNADGLVIGAPDLDRLYALAQSTPLGAASPSGTAIVVLDAVTQRVLDRWPAQGAYSSVAVTDDGRWVVAGAAASPGDVNAGLPSMAVHDPATGQVGAWFTGLDTSAPPLLGSP